ncbi:MAG: hypothetical protein II323_05235 [Tidjanibacter sp.]|nr:hypothetical protein [Tidjanibacter sp.]
MKKLFISLVAIAAAVFATSCTNDIESGIKFNGKTATVGFEVSTPELATRTFGDGKSATNLYYGVYDEQGVLLPEISVIHRQNTPEVINIKTTVNFELVTGDRYTIVFWAENAGSAATIDWANKKMTFDPTTASVEAYDAFWAAIPVVVEGPATIKADLYRPFAQVNIGTADFEKARKAGMEVEEVKLTVKSAETLNLFDGTVENEKTYTYDYAGLPTEAYPVAGYDYMTMNYVLVAKEKHLVDVTMDYLSKENKNYHVVYGNVPVQRNYRTNIYGNLLTDQTGVIVEIKPAFEDAFNGEWDGTNSYRVSTAAEFQEVLDTATTDVTIFFDADIVGDVTVLQKENVDIRVEGEGKKYDGTLYIHGNARANGAETLTIKNVNFYSEDSCDFISSNSTASEERYAHNVTIENCTFAGNENSVALRFRQAYDIVVKDCEAYGIHSLAQNTSTSGQVYDNVTIDALRGINLLTAAVDLKVVNCNITATKADGYGIRIDAAAGNVGTIENTEVVAYEPLVLRSAKASYTMYINKSTLTPNNGGEKDIVISGETPAIYIDGGLYEVGATIVKNAGELNAALANNKEVIFLAEGDYTGTFAMKSNTTILGNGQLVGTIDLNGADNVILKDIKFDAANAVYCYDGSGSAKQPASIFSSGKNITTGSVGVEIDGCTFSGTFVDGGGAIAFTDQNRSGSGNITIKNCVFECEGGYFFIYTFYSGNNGYLNIENNTFKSTCYNPIYLGRYQSSVPVVVKENTFEKYGDFASVAYIQAHSSSYTVSFDAAAAATNIFGN